MNDAIRDRKGIKEKLKNISLKFEDIQIQMDNNSILHSDIIANLFENQKPDIDTYNFTYKVNQAKMSIVFLNMVRYAEDIEKLIDELNEAIKDFPPFCPEEKTAIKKKALT